MDLLNTIMNKRFATLFAAIACVYAVQAEKPMSGLTFDASKGVAGSVTMPDGQVVNYTAYTDLFYVTNVEDSTYQRMNVFVPEGADQHTPIFMRNYVGGYMVAKAADINPADASGRALAEGYVVAIPGARGRNSEVNGTYTGGERHLHRTRTKRTARPEGRRALPATFRQPHARRCGAYHKRRHECRRSNVLPCSEPRATTPFMSLA